MNSRSLISIGGKSWPCVRRYFTTLASNACQMLRFVPVDQETGVWGCRLTLTTGALLKRSQVADGKLKNTLMLVHKI